jgi:lysophospholipase L1-like esterase
MRVSIACLLFPLMTGVVLSAPVTDPATLRVVGDWDVEVSLRKPPLKVIVSVPPPETVEVKAERHASVPLFNPRAGGWARGARLQRLVAQETTTPFLLEPQSLVVRSGEGADATTYRLGEDYQADLDWGTFGRTADSRIGEGQPVVVSYRYAPQRLDAVVLDKGGNVLLRRGEPRSSAARPADVVPTDRRLANIWLPGRMTKLGAEHVFPILETSYPEKAKPKPAPAEQLVPKALQKLRTGKKLRILAWGDSVTVGTYVPDPAHERWQEQFVADIELVTEAWGGRNTGSYLAEPPGSEHNYREKVLGAKPDLIVSEFVNDAGLNPQQVEERYSALLKDFQSIGAEWIILTPHYVRPDWMGLNRERDIDKDPRPYVAGLREFAARHQVALADASLRYGRLWRQGIPYTTLMLNSINHPDAHGMRLFAEALIELFP